MSRDLFASAYASPAPGPFGPRASHGRPCGAILRPPFRSASATSTSPLPKSTCAAAVCWSRKTSGFFPRYPGAYALGVDHGAGAGPCTQHGPSQEEVESKTSVRSQRATPGTAAHGADPRRTMGAISPCRRGSRNGSQHRDQRVGRALLHRIGKVNRAPYTVQKHLAHAPYTVHN